MPVFVPPVHVGAFSIQEYKLIDYANDSTLMAVVTSPGVRVTLAYSVQQQIDDEHAMSHSNTPPVIKHAPLTVPVQ